MLPINLGLTIHQLQCRLLVCLGQAWSDDTPELLMAYSTLKWSPRTSSCQRGTEALEMDHVSLLLCGQLRQISAAKGHMGACPL